AKLARPRKPETGQKKIFQQGSLRILHPRHSTDAPAAYKDAATQYLPLQLLGLAVSNQKSRRILSR
ncbi:MAG TPA: hypothetical protein PKD78_07720, partial [Saprospiraceae bacterium]|nr:hypothetical protein [Saprospiraceae bacterium]